MGEFKEHYFDYSRGRENRPTLFVMVGISGSGKSTECKARLNKTAGRAIRLNRDDMRRMLYVNVPWEAHKDNYVRAVELDMAKRALHKGLDVYIDDTNCIRKTRYSFEELAKEVECKLCIVEMTVSFDECVKRDLARHQSGECVGKDVILKQYKDLNKNRVEVEDAGKPLSKPVLTKPAMMREMLHNGGFTLRLPEAPIVIYDVDGTLANHEGVRNPYDESRVIHDNPYPAIVAQARKDYETKNLFIFSGRKEKSGDDTCDWMEMHGVKFDLMLNRLTKDNRHDTEVKGDMLDLILELFPIEKIEYVVDDRPVVCRLWERRGLKVQWARGRDLADF
jgi:predicted kinase